MADCNGLTCSCGKTFNSASALTMHCEAKEHSFMMVAQCQKGKTHITNFTFHNTNVEMKASVDGFSIQTEESVGAGPGAGAPEIRIVRQEQQRTALPPEPSGTMTRAKLQQVSGPKCVNCNKAFSTVNGLWNHCVAKDHKCCSSLDRASLASKGDFERHLNRHGQASTAEVNQVAYPRKTPRSASTKFRSQIKVVTRQAAARHPLPPKPVPQVELPPLKPIVPAVNNHTATASQGKPAGILPASITQQSEPPERRTQWYGFGAQYQAQSQNPASLPMVMHGDNSRLHQSYMQHTASSQPYAYTPSATQTLSSGSLGPPAEFRPFQDSQPSVNHDGEGKTKPVDDGAQRTECPAPGSMGQVWRGLNYSMMKSKSSIFPGDDEMDEWD